MITRSRKGLPLARSSLASFAVSAFCERHLEAQACVVSVSIDCKDEGIEISTSRAARRAASASSVAFFSAAVVAEHAARPRASAATMLLASVRVVFAALTFMLCVLLVVASLVCFFITHNHSSHFRISRWPPPAAPLHISASHACQHAQPHMVRVQRGPLFQRASRVWPGDVHL